MHSIYVIDARDVVELYVDKVLRESKSLREVAERITSAHSMSRRRLPYVVALISDRMRGGYIGEDLATPENWYHALELLARDC